jgi:hypothetical protein
MSGTEHDFCANSVWSKVRAVMTTAKRPPFRALSAEEFRRLSDTDRMEYLQEVMADLRQKMDATKKVLADVKARLKDNA